MKAFAYLRVSGKSQLDGDGFPRQEHAIQAYAKAHGIQIVEQFQERAVPGKTEWDDRPAWVEMIGKLNGTNTIIIEKLDRLARDLMVQEHIIADLKRRGINLISVHEPDLDSEDATRILFRQMMGAIHQYEKTMIVKKLQLARHRIRTSTGRCEGRKPYGHYPGEVATAARIRDLSAQGETYTAITEHLNSAGIPARSGGAWHVNTVRRIAERKVA